MSVSTCDIVPMTDSYNSDLLVSSVFIQPNMTPEVTCSIVFGIVASCLAVVTILQAHRRGPIRSTLIYPCLILQIQDMNDLL